MDVYKEKRVVVLEKQRQLEIIKDVHEGIGESSHSKAMSSHHGRDSTYSKIGARFLWYRMYDDVADFIRSCGLCQKQGDIKISTKTELHSVPIPGDVMKQVGVDLCNLPEVDGFHTICLFESTILVNDLRLGH